MARRMLSLPWNLLGGYTRPRNSPNHFNFPQQIPHIADSSLFLSSYEQKYGPTHPFFYACKLSEALRMAKEEKKLVFVYLHDSNHPFTPSFCSETLRSEIVIQFLDVNFVSWGTLSDKGEGMNLVATLRPASFPCCLVLAPTGNGDHFVVLRQIEGPVSPEQLVEILQRTMEEQGFAFAVGDNNKQRGKIREDRRLRDEQDTAYRAALQIDMEKERTRKSELEKVEKQHEVSHPKGCQIQTQTQKQKQIVKARESSGGRDTRNMGTSKTAKDLNNTTLILIRFPDGERREKSFSFNDTIGSIFKYIDSLGNKGIGAYRLVSGFPRRIYGYEDMNMTLAEARLYPRASLFLELIS